MELEVSKITRTTGLGMVQFPDSHTVEAGQAYVVSAVPEGLQSDTVWKSAHFWELGSQTMGAHAVSPTPGDPFWQASPSGQAMSPQCDPSSEQTWRSGPTHSSCTAPARQVSGVQRPDGSQKVSSLQSSESRQSTHSP